MPINPGSFLVQCIPLLMVFFVFYAVVIRPGRVSEYKRWTTVAALQGGERVVLVSGLLGRFTARNGDELQVELDTGFCVNVLETGILRVLPEPPAVASEPMLGQAAA